MRKELNSDLSTTNEYILAQPQKSDYDYSLESGIIHLTGNVDNNLLVRIPFIRQTMLKISENDPKKPIIFIWDVNFGGSVHIMNSFVELFKIVQNPIVVYTSGASMSASTYIGMMADFYVVGQSTAIMVHYGSSSYTGDYSNFMNYTNSYKEQQDIYTRFFKWRTKLPNDKVRNLLTTDTFMNAYLALEYNIVDMIFDGTDPDFFKPERFVLTGEKRCIAWSREQAKIYAEINDIRMK